MDKENQNVEPEKEVKENKPAKEAKAAPKAPSEGAPAEKKEESTRIPTAKKRMIQSKKRQLNNRSLKSEVKTAIRTLKEDYIANKDLVKAQEQVNIIFSLMDKGKKKNMFKQNKANRVKSTISKLVQNAK